MVIDILENGGTDFIIIEFESQFLNIPESLEIPYKFIIERKR